MQLRSFSLLHYIASPENIFCGRCVDTPVSFLITNIYIDPVLIQRLLLTAFSFTTNQTSQVNPFFVAAAVCEFSIAALHHYSCYAIIA
jgi:hypothetical protein